MLEEISAWRSSAPTAGRPISSVSSAESPRNGGPARGKLFYTPAKLCIDWFRPNSFIRYIKELADRIIFIEGKLGSQGGNPDVLDTTADGFSPVAANDSAKRPFSSISGDANGTPVGSRLAAWASEQRSSHQTPPAHPAYGRGRLLAKRIEGDAPGRPIETLDGIPADSHDELDRGIDEAVYFG